MGYTLLDINISKQTDFNHRRKVAWLRSDRRFHLSDGVCVSLPYYFIEGEVLLNTQKIAKKCKELGYDTLIFGARYEIQSNGADFVPLVFDAFAKERIDVVLKLQFQNELLEKLKSRNYLILRSERESLLASLRKIPLPALKGIYWELTPLDSSLLQSAQFRKWTLQEIYSEEIRLFEEAFNGISLLIAEPADPFFREIVIPSRTILSISPYTGKPWEEYLPTNPILKETKEGYHPYIILHNKGKLFMGEGLWPINGGDHPIRERQNLENYWGDCDLFNQFPSDTRFSKSWGVLGLEARLLWLKMLSAKDKSTHRIQLDSWGYQLKELELRSEENPLIRHFIVDAWYFLSNLQSQPVHQGIGSGGFWRGRPLTQDPHSDGSPWFKDSRIIFSL